LGLSAHNAFRPDDFDAINAAYFSELRTDGRPFLDPSGWLETYSTAAELMPEIPVRSSDLGRYYLDEGHALGATKDAIVSLISAWERRSVRDDAVTLCHSISEGTLSILVALRRRGIREILFETPGYAVTMNQAEYLGLHRVMIPTIRTENFRADMARLVPAAVPTAVWITQPRMSLGSNQRPADVRRILERLGPADFLVVDEATEQEFPSVLRDSEVGSHPRMIRIRGVTKGMGLNGVRLAFVLHDPGFRDDLESAQEVVGGSLDLFSLRAAAVLAADVNRFTTMLYAARQQTTGLHSRAARSTAGSRVVLSPLVNGYMGSAWLAVPDPNRYDETRRELLSFCRVRRTAVIVGASMRFAFDPTFEAIRLNYFNRENHILDGVKTIVDFASTLRDTE
jgi:histidinol-phosphate/aromatic aminotransferase/cobyric acid decarboxylase-like protein